MRVAVPVLLGGMIIGLIVFYISGIALPGSSPEGRPTTIATTPEVSESTSRAIVSTVTTSPVLPTGAGRPGQSPTPIRPGTATPAASPRPGAGTVVASNDGSPLSNAQIVSALQSTGLEISGRDGQYAVRSGSASQTFSVHVYRSITDLQGEWTTQVGSPPQPRSGQTPPLAYWNQNAVLTFPSGYDAALARQVAEAFLAVP